MKISKYLQDFVVETCAAVRDLMGPPGRTASPWPTRRLQLPPSRQRNWWVQSHSSSRLRESMRFSKFGKESPENVRRCQKFRFVRLGAFCSRLSSICGAGPGCRFVETFPDPEHAQSIFEVMPQSCSLWQKDDQKGQLGQAPNRGAGHPC